MQLFSCELSKIFKNNYSEEHVWTAASEAVARRSSVNKLIFKVSQYSQEKNL